VKIKVVAETLASWLRLNKKSQGPGLYHHALYLYFILYNI